MGMPEKETGRMRPQARKSSGACRRGKELFSMKKILGGKIRDNRGMSLIEVVVAIAILSIVMLTVLHSFVYSARYNARSRERQQTTAAAQTVMENFKAYSVQEIFDKCAATPGSFTLSGGEGKVRAGSPGGDMEFAIMGMYYQNQRYDVKVNLTSHNSLAADVDTLLYSNPTQEHAAAYVGDAGTDVAALRGIMEEVAAVWTQREQEALSGGTATPAPGSVSPSGTAHSASEVDSSRIHITRRELKVDITHSSSGGNYVAQVSCTYFYDVTGYPYIKDAYGGTDTFDISGEYPVDLSGTGGAGAGSAREIYNQGSSLECLNLYYYPAYSYVPGDPGTGVPDADSPVRVGEDHIYINNYSDTDVRCYIYKQKNLAVSDARLSTSENVYKVNLHLTNAYVYNDNLNTVLGNDEGSLTDSRINVSVTGRGGRYHGIGYVAAGIHESNIGMPAMPMPTDMPTETVEKKRLMYDVLISVYNQGDLESGGTALSTLEGTIIE